MDDDHTLQQALEELAGNAFSLQDDEHEQPEPISQTANRWKQVFGLSSDEAIDRIMAHRLELTRIRISDVHWDMVREEATGIGHDRESYEYSLELQKKKARLPDLVPAVENDAGRAVTFLLELDGPLEDAETVRQIAETENLPALFDGKSLEDGCSMKLCSIDGPAKAAILRWVSEKGGGFEPTIIVDPRSMR